MGKIRIPAVAVAFSVKIEGATVALNRANLSGVIGKETRTSLERSLENYRQNLRSAWHDTPNAPALADKFAQVNGKAESFTLPASDALDTAAWAEARLEALGVPKPARAGVEVMRASGGPAAAAYKHSAIGTAYTLRRTSAGHYDLISIRRTAVHPRQQERKVLSVSAVARDAIHQKAMAGICLLPVAR
jgi:hypothetical protein